VSQSKLESIYTGVSAADRWPGARRSEDPGRGTRHEREDILERYARLTARERDVLKHVVSGQLNKQIAADLGTPECTIKAHRGQVMRKMQARTLATLALFAVRAGILEFDSRNKEATHERSTKVEYRSWSARGTVIATADLGHYSTTS